MYKDCLKKSLMACNIDHNNWTETAKDRAAWRYNVKESVTSFETSRREDIKKKRQLRKQKVNEPPAPTDQCFKCKYCKRSCRSRIGLVSHECACSRRGRKQNS